MWKLVGDTESKLASAESRLADLRPVVNGVAPPTLLRYLDAGLKEEPASDRKQRPANCVLRAPACFPVFRHCFSIASFALLCAIIDFV